MSTALTGPAANLGDNMKAGVLAGFHRANTHGGIHGRPLRLIALDDGYEPSRTTPNIRKLIEQDQVLGIIGNVGTPTAIAALPIINEYRRLFFAPFTGAGILRKNPPDHFVINYRASFGEVTASMIVALVTIG
jgi:ABC-type branched-subunit amino acid transport system substrate-binding protein